MTEEKKEELKEEAPEKEAAQTFSQEELAEQARKFFPKDTSTFLKGTLAFLADLAWIQIGLSLNPFSGKIERNLPQAKLAIDTAEAILGKLETFLEESEKPELKNLLLTLQMNFVEQSKRAD